MPFTRYLFPGSLTAVQSQNSKLNILEMDEKKTFLSSCPRRIILELTNDCNMNCVMCGRYVAEFNSSYLPLEIVQYLRPLFNTVEEVTLMGWGEPTIHPHFTTILEILSQYDVRKYFLTNGKLLDSLKKAIFDFRIDLVRVSVNGARPETNDSARKGSSLKEIMDVVSEIAAIKKEKGLSYPYLGFVMCLSQSNLHEFPVLVDLAAKIGLNNCKGVFLTAFDDNLADEVLWYCSNHVRKVFDLAQRKAAVAGINLDLPNIPGSDPAGTKSHHDCTVCWRDLFIGADTYLRPCMSYNGHLFKLDTTLNIFDIWNAPEYQNLRVCVNDEEKMPYCCSRCFQSSFANWNLKRSFLPDKREKIAPWGG
jgi:MoaA/NifB/PqqE/SkfB family radical SAM enzyme